MGPGEGNNFEWRCIKGSCLCKVRGRKGKLEKKKMYREKGTCVGIARRNVCECAAEYGARTRGRA